MITKKNVISMPDKTIDIINQLKPIKFDFKTDKSDESFYAGFNIEEIESILPNLIIPPLPTETDDMYGIDYAGFVPYLVKAIQELKKEVDELKSKLNNTK